MIGSFASLRPVALALLVAVPSFTAGACGASGTTPDCKPDVTANGIQPVEGGCSGFAVCMDEKGNPADPAKVCCKDRTGTDLQTCLFGYGAAPPPGGTTTTGTGGGGGGGAGGATTTGTGSGGGGGGAGGGTGGGGGK